MNKSLKLKYFDFSLGLLLEVIKENYFTNLPEDAEIKDFYITPTHRAGSSRVLRIIVSSEEFEPVPEGEMIPRLELVLMSRYRPSIEDIKHGIKEGLIRLDKDITTE